MFTTIYEFSKQYKNFTRIQKPLSLGGTERDDTLDSFTKEGLSRDNYHSCRKWLFLSN